MKAINNVMLQGRIGKEPEFRYTKQNNEVCNFSLAVSRGKDKEPDWFNVTVYEAGTIEDIRKYFHKGYSIVVHGSLRKQMWEDKNGVSRNDVNIICDGVSFFGDGAKREEKAAEEYSHPTTAVSSFVPLDTADGELPF